MRRYCNLCGIDIDGRPDVRGTYLPWSWSKYARALYTTAYGTFLSKGYLDQILISTVCKCGETPAKDGYCIKHVITTLSAYPARGFLFHESCYQLLEWSCTEAIDIHALDLVIRSFGLATGRPYLTNWGHTYSGLYDGDPSTHHRVISPRYISILDDPSWQTNFPDPLVLDESIYTHLRTPHPPALESVPAAPNTPSAPPCDPFAHLPAEILDLILSWLPNADVHSARLASRVLASTPLSPTFFRSRFNPQIPGPHAHIPEPLLHKAGLLNDPLFASARAVHEALVACGGGPHLRARKRVWGVIQPLARALDGLAVHKRMSGSVVPCGEGMASLAEPGEGAEDRCRWSCAHGELREGMGVFQFGCRAVYKRCVSLEERVTKHMSPADVNSRGWAHGQPALYLSASNLKQKIRIARSGPSNPASIELTGDLQS
ncbi:hypothetical protein BS50DRAFT_678550 [Corynespora cassiicola Philippines]|uniref:F-box domain-containing protein n=1 Tax=Corynespora cassiicola Philippines TaxID=1448308 RepID=A0A2T2NG84_CORCC|nr:hypothetical protein BS50DRAFT_678550 [Corynespora cassiicola Philippines]